MFKKLFGSASPDTASQPSATFTPTEEGLRYELPGVAAEEWLAAPFSHGDAAPLGAALAQLYMDGYGTRGDAAFVLPWKDVYAVLQHPEHAGATTVLGFPEQAAIKPSLGSSGSIGDAGFVVAIESWEDARGVPLRDPPKVVGATATIEGRTQLLDKAVWSLLEQLRAFHATPPADRTPTANERAWAQMRRWAKASDTRLSNYLEQTIVVTPEKLRLDLRQGRFNDERVLEVIPGFDGAPPKWLEQFDRLPAQDSYSVVDGTSLTKVVLSPEVKQVLARIKRMPGRRVVGPEAEAFVRNPFAVIGPGAGEVVDVGQVEKALKDAGVSSQRFRPEVRRAEKGHVDQVLLVVETVGAESATDEEVPFADAAHLAKFCDRLAGRIEKSYQCCAWEGYDLEILGETPDHLSQLRAWLEEWRHASVWSASDIFDLSNYSDRVAEIGVEKAYVVPVLARRSVELDWFVDNVLFGLAFRPPGSDKPVVITIPPDQVDEIKKRVEEAEQSGETTVMLPGAPCPVPVETAKIAVKTIEDTKAALERKDFDPSKPRPDKPKAERKQLVIKSNIDIADHVEARAALLQVADDAAPRIPASLRATTGLKPHQLYGVAWLQHLWSLSPHSCRGALLADDMGLGKTLQLLTFIASCIERDPKLDPVLVVAPLALLENWRAEVEKFFLPDSLPVLTLYGKTLASLRVPEAELAAELTQHGITRLLRKDWLGDARIVLTTYETMRDLEFTLAAQRWSIMVCDEAQKIKNPGAMVTRTAKKQNVRFRIACTGTPVENTLMDLWCLFDFIQPGLLGALNQFSRTYRQPIEAKTDEQRAKVQELRNLIEPQTLRRTKQEVARDILPLKLEHEDCRELSMSEQQLSMYWAALEELKKQRATNPSAQLQTLHSIRRICSDPHWQASGSALRMPLKQLFAESPKMRWLVDRLHELQRKSIDGAGEKVIVFCEFRDLQTLLQRVIRECFEIDAFVVNGDTSASLDVENSRQKLIDRFQRKPGFNAIILSPLAVGFGVNIQAANHVIHFTRNWNPAKEDQATDRAYRIGQQRDVTVYYPSVVGDKFKSFDTILHELLEWKRGIAQDMLNAAGDLSVADFDGMAA